MGARARKRGRPRKPGPRDEKGRLLPAVDRGTPEQQRRLLALCNGSGDVTLAASVSGILFANHIITAAQRSAAERFAKARAAIFGQPLSAKRDDAPSVTDERLAVLERRYNALCGRLTIDQQLAVISVALEQRPVWLRRQLIGLPLTAPDQRERRDLLEGLDALTR